MFAAPGTQAFCQSCGRERDNSIRQCLGIAAAVLVEPSEPNKLGDGVGYDRNRWQSHRAIRPQGGEERRIGRIGVWHRLRRRSVSSQRARCRRTAFQVSDSQQTQAQRVGDKAARSGVQFPAARSPAKVLLPTASSARRESLTAPQANAGHRASSQSEIGLALPPRGSASVGMSAISSTAPDGAARKATAPYNPGSTPAMFTPPLTTGRPAPWACRRKDPYQSQQP
jgi:hypothetical protein